MDRPDSDPDLRLVRRAGRGDGAAFRGLYDRHRSRLMGYLVKVLGDRTAAEDVFQEVWIKVMRSIEQFRPGNAASFRSWLYRIASNAAVDRMRRDSRKDAGLRPVIAADDDETDPIDGLPAPDVDPERAAGGRVLGDALRGALRRLPERQRVAVVLRHQQGLSYRELASALDVPEGTAKILVHRGVIELRERLKEWSDA